MKQCKDCKVTKEQSDFYGVQGECKECTKKRVNAREIRLRNNPDWIQKERARHREKYHRLGYKTKHNPTPEKKKEIMERYKAKYPEKLKAKNKSSHLKPSSIGNHLHHWNYNLEFAKDVIEISEKDHNTIHRFMTYCPIKFIYTDENGNELDTKEKHLEYIKQILK